MIFGDIVKVPLGHPTFQSSGPTGPSGTLYRQCHNSEGATLTRPKAPPSIRHESLINYLIGIYSLLISLWPVKRERHKSALVPGYSPHDGTWLPIVFSHFTLTWHMFLVNFGRDQWHRSSSFPSDIPERDSRILRFPDPPFLLEKLADSGYALHYPHRPLFY